MIVMISFIAGLVHLYSFSYMKLDAPALKRANIGIAVSGATSAARAASDIVYWHLD